jgi:hypothetical protein
MLYACVQPNSQHHANFEKIFNRFLDQSFRHWLFMINSFNDLVVVQLRIKPVVVDLWLSGQLEYGFYLSKETELIRLLYFPTSITRRKASHRKTILWSFPHPISMGLLIGSDTPHSSLWPYVTLAPFINSLIRKHTFPWSRCAAPSSLYLGPVSY